MIMICLTERVSEIEIFSVSLKYVMFTIDHIISLNRNVKSLSRNNIVILNVTLTK